MLRIADPYIAWGYPSMKTIRELIYKRGYAKTEGQRHPITNNTIIEEKLGMDFLRRKFTSHCIIIIKIILCKFHKMFEAMMRNIHVEGEAQKWLACVVVPFSPNELRLIFSLSFE